MLSSSLFYHCFVCLRYDARNDVVPCWIGPTNCQPKWLRTRSAEIRHEEKYFDCWSYHVRRWTVNETTWKTVPKLPKSVFWKPNCGNWIFSFWILRSVRFSSVFRKPISDIFIRFRTCLLEANDWSSLHHICRTEWSYPRLPSPLQFIRCHSDTNHSKCMQQENAID